MSDIMKPMPFEQIIRRMLQEYAMHGSIFNVGKIQKVQKSDANEIFGETLELPVGIAAGPHTQLAHNIVADYAAGARFLELKTVQIMYGEELGIPKPCIRADDECYNTEWSSEFRADRARDEYIKAWFACKVLAKELELGDPDGFIFNMSVGYNLEGIQTELVNSFIDGLMNAEDLAMFQHCKSVLLSMLPDFNHVDEAFIEGISPKICRSMTLSTMHGCPPEEIEAIATYLLKEKHIHTYIKCNPTLLGYEMVRDILDQMGFDYITFGREQFIHDLQIEQALPMIRRLMELAEREGLTFGVKLTNTFQVEIHNQELPGDAMYMSGKALYPLSIHVAKVLSAAFAGKLPMSFSGGADKNNIQDLYAAGIWPITVCTVLLRPAGLENMFQLSKLLMDAEKKEDLFTDMEAIGELADGVLGNKRFIKSDKAREKYDKHESYHGVHSPSYRCRVLCKNCVRVCPNRTNEILSLPDGDIILHIDGLCNECGNCQYFCVEPCIPYQDRITLFPSVDLLIDSKNRGFVLEGTDFTYRWEDTVATGGYEDLPAPLKEVYDAIKVQHPYLL
ncbi:MAG: selenate reductase [Tissierellia bacterium]|nr:selenate reductase [Tissierellia bacterium]